MKKSVIKGAGVVLFATIASAVVVSGNYVNRRNRYQQRVELAENSAEIEQEKLIKIDKQSKELFSESGDFLSAETTKQKIEDIHRQLLGIRVNAVDFGIEEGSMPESIKELASKQGEIEYRLAIAEKKARLQEATSQLFTTEISNWQEVSDLVISDTIQLVTVTTIREELNFIEDSDWKTAITNKLNQADTQVVQANDLEERLAAAIVDPMAVTYERYLNVSYEIESVPNEQIRAKLRAMVGQLATAMGIQ